MEKQFFKLLKKCFLTGLFFVFLGTHYAFAQQTISGTVTDETGGPVPGANILVQGTTNGTQTDFDGNFSIEASSEDVLVISYLGYATQTVTVGSQTSITVQLAEDASQLDEVVVIGYGTSKKSDLTGAISQVSSESFEKQPLTRVEDALQGRASGVAVSRAGGGPGSAIKVRIRGVNSINGDNSPLVVIDGVIGGDLSTLNPNDIASMEVLKDASASAIYGSRASNGVILVSTKKGRGDAKVSLDVFTTIATIPNQLPTLGAGDFATIENSRRLRQGGQAIFTDAEITNLYASGGTNYQDELFQTGISKNVQLSVSGSEGKTSYFLSGNYVDQEGTIINTGYERASLRANLNVDVTEKLKVGLNIFGTRATTLNDITALNRFQGSVVIKALTWDPTTPIYNSNGEFNRFSERALGSLNINPIEDLNTTQIDQVNDRINANLNLNYAFTNNFSYSLIAGVSTFNNNNQTYRTDEPDNDVSYGNAKNTSHQISNVLTWQKAFGDHNFKMTGVYEFSGFEGKFNGYTGNNLAVPAGFYFGEFAAGKNFSNSYSKSAIESVMGRAEYNLGSSFFLTGTVRVDSSSKFREGNRTGTFPSVSAKYSFANTEFIENSKVLSNFGIRAGWGQVGNENIAPYTTFPSVNANSTFSFDGSSVSPGSSPDGYGNEDLTWETTTQTNVGLDFGFFNGRLNLALDGYKKNTTDLLLDIPVPTTNGGGAITRNVGEVENTGIDVSLSGSVYATDNFSWDSNLSFSYSKNEVVDLGGVDEIQGTFQSIDGQSRIWNVIQVGQPLGQFNGSTFLGTWKSTDNIPLNDAGTPIAEPGDARYLRDADGNRVIGAIGNGTPTTFWGFNNTLSYKNWDLNVFIQGVHDFEVLNAVQGVIVGATGNQRSFLAAEQINQWTPTNETDVPAGGLNDAGSTRYVEKGDFIRLSNLSLGYTIRDIGKTNTNAKIYVSGQNLFLITDYSGYDPEHTSTPADNAGNVDVAAGINTGSYPNPRTLSIGVKLDF